VLIPINGRIRSPLSAAAGIPLTLAREDLRVPRLLVVHHTPSPALAAILGAVQEGIAMVEEVELVVRPALSAGAADVLTADGVLLGTPANIGYMSGALKHFFDTVYYPCLDASGGLPYGVYVHGNDDTAGALASIQRITGALRWKLVAAPLSLTGAPDQADLEACRELGATVAVSL
jgi:flavorubredoxin